MMQNEQSKKTQIDGEILLPYEESKKEEVKVPVNRNLYPNFPNQNPAP